MVIVPIPLLDSNDNVEMFRVHNLPVPLNFNGTNTTDTVAKYQLETEAIAVNNERTNVALLTRKEHEGCSKPIVGFCAIRSPIFPISLSKFCVVSLFMWNNFKLQKSCRTLVQVDSVLPTADYLSDGHRLLTTQTPLTLSLTCRGSERE